ncbi:MAG: hypothetical protein HZB76_02365 [Chlamydiae bacterium]|nr:hypothetical protein [Chlamydiota bacterium]
MRYFLRTLLAVICSAQLFAKDVETKEKLDPKALIAQDLELEGKQEDPDVQALRQWIKEKRMVTVREKGGDLAIMGEVRTECQGYFEDRNGVRQRGRGSPNHIPVYACDVEVNLMFDYHTDRSWASVKLEFDNDMGTDSGSANHIALERAYFGGRAIQGETFTIDAELGRKNLSMFDSKIEFSAILDGAIFRFNKAFDNIGDLYFNSAIFLISDFYKHFGEVGELGMLHIANTGFLIKYSFINWKKTFSGSNEETRIRNERFRFGISQFLIGYQIDLQDKFTKLIKPYMAILYNHFAKPVAVSDHKRANWGGFAGVSFGTIETAGDWALDANFQFVQAQAVPEYDSAGIKRGNAPKVGFYTLKTDGTGGDTTVATAVGGGNFYGFQIDFLYAITQNLTMQNIIQRSWTYDTHIGPNINFKGFEVEFIYAF